MNYEWASNLASDVLLELANSDCADHQHVIAGWLQVAFDLGWADRNGD